MAELYRCYHCGVESNGNAFKYFDNKKVDQPRFQCHHCRKFFTLGSHGRPQGKTYAKKRNEDPVELKSLSRQCRHCGVADNALFKYYNNNNLSQPRFKCLSCVKQFQMRLLGTGEERRLVHTSSLQRAVPCRRKQGVPEPVPNTSSSSDNGFYQPFDGSFVPVPCETVLPLEPGARLLPEMSDEDVQYSNFFETELAEEETYEGDFNSWTGNGDNPELPPSFGEDARFGDLLEAEIMAEESNDAPTADAFSSTANLDDEYALPPTWSNEAPTADAFSSTANLDDEYALPPTWSNEAPTADAFSSTANLDDEYALPPTWSNEDAELMGFTDAGAADNIINEALYAEMVSDNMAEMVSGSTFSNQSEVMYGTLALESSAADAACSEPWTWTQNDDTIVDSYSESYADAAAACCRQMDLDMAAENSSMQTAPSWIF